MMSGQLQWQEDMSSLSEQLEKSRRTNVAQLEMQMQDNKNNLASIEQLQNSQLKWQQEKIDLLNDLQTSRASYVKN